MTSTTTMINGIDTEALKRLSEEVRANPAKGMATFRVATRWRGGTKTETRVDGWELGGRKLGGSFTVMTDEPPELLGERAHANPQEVLMAAMNACMMVGYTAGCAMMGIELELLEIRTEGTLDLRGFLGIDSDVKPGYDELRYTVIVKGSGTAEEFDRVHQMVMATSPNYFNVSRPVRLKGELRVS